MKPLFDFIERSFFLSPYAFFPLAVYIYALLTLFGNFHDSPVWTSRLLDPDDYMRLNETINWLSGNSWYDLSEPRLSPGAHTVIHWSRLIDLPIALVMWPMIGLLGLTQSAMIASLIIPPLMFILFLILIPQIGRFLLGKKYKNLSLTYLIFTPILFFNFSPGRVDHHNWELLIAAFGFYGLQRLLLCRNSWYTAVFMACAFACGLWIGTEIMPCLMLTISCMALFASWRGGFALRNAAVFGLALAGATIVVLFFALPPTEWNGQFISWFSLSDVIFSLLVSGIFLIGWLIGRYTTRRWLRLSLFIALGACAACLYLGFVPQAIEGPFANYETYNASTALQNIGEAKPVIDLLQINPHEQLSYSYASANFMTYMFLPCVSFLFCGRAAFLTRSRKRQIWIIYAFFIGGTSILALLCQVRVLWFEQIFELPPLAYLTWRWWQQCPKLTNAGREHAAIATIIMGFVMTQMVPGLLEVSFTNKNTPQQMTESPTCNLKKAAEYIHQREGDRQHTILNIMDDGPELLFRTPYNVIGGNFNVIGNKDIFSFFSSHNDSEAIGILRKWHADLVLLCQTPLIFYTGSTPNQPWENANLYPDKDGKLHFIQNAQQPTLIERLVNDAPPVWLKSASIPIWVDPGLAGSPREFIN